MSVKKFLSARWQYLCMFNYEVDAAVLTPHIPPGTELDTCRGKSLVSIVGFLFNDTRVWGVRWPFHVHFEEVNLRYYVRRKVDGRWRRGTAFISEIVPKRIIAMMANRLYNEHYSVARMNHQLSITPETIQLSYEWKKSSGYQNKMMVTADNLPQALLPGSEAEFILEHYYGYNQLNKHTTIEYGVEHPSWKVYPVTGFSIDCDAAALYGKDFASFLQNQTPHSVLLAEGSEVVVRKPVYLKPGL
jgi:uncharacterized protein